MANVTPNNLDFHYIKSSSFRAVHCDGVWGGATPRGYISMCVYSERSPLPKKLTHQLLDGGRLGEETGREGKKGIIREVEVEVVMDSTMALSLADWLQEHAQPLEAQQKGDK